MAGPKPGEPGLAIIAAHRDTHFRFLKHVRIGDEIAVTDAAGKTRVFVIAETRIVKADRSGLEVEGGPPRLALVTCWPFDAQRRGDDRFVAIAELQAKGPAGGLR
jgi:sortase A